MNKELEEFLKEIKDLEESGVEFATVVIDSYDSIKNKTKGEQDENKS